MGDDLAGVEANQTLGQGQQESHVVIDDQEVFAARTCEKKANDRSSTARAHHRDAHS